MNTQKIRIEDSQIEIDEFDAELIRELYSSGLSYAEIACKFEISKWRVGRICRGELSERRLRRSRCAAYKNTVEE